MAAPRPPALSELLASQVARLRARRVRGPRRPARQRVARRRAVAAATIVAVGCGGVVALATRSPGYPTQHVEANAGAVWVTNDRAGLFGRINAPARALDAAFAPVDRSVETHQLDVLQSDGAVVARDRVVGRLAPVDVRTGQLVRERAVSAPDTVSVAVGGGTVAMLEPGTGILHATWAPVDAVAPIDALRPDDKPTASVPLASGLGVAARGSAATVAADGAVYLVGTSGEVRVLRPDSAPGRFVTASSSLNASLQDVQVALVGEHLVVVDVVGGVAVLPGGRQVALPASLREAVIQANGPDAAQVLLASPTALVAVDLSTGELTTVYDRGTGPPAAPVVLGDCRYGAWAGAPGAVVRQCSSDPATPVSLEGMSSLVAPVLRQNRTSVVLNEGASGGVWELEDGTRLDDWASVAPTPTAPKPSQQQSGPSLAKSEKPPRAVADDFGARAGRTSVLHPLDNDANPSGSVLSIRSVTEPRPGNARLSISPDGQSVQIAIPPGVGSVQFGYTIDDGKGHQSQAPVVVRVRQPQENGRPTLRPGYAKRVVPIASQGRLALPVVGDWRDPDSDPVVLASATDDKATVPVSSDGRIHYSAPAASGSRRIAYVITDGRATATGTVAIDVLGKRSTTTSPAQTEPDVARGEVGKQITFRPLDNDLPGVDPTTPSARLELAGEVVAPDGCETTTDLKTGVVTLTAGAPGTYLLTYTAAYGSAAYARGTIRVDVSPPARRDAVPVAMLDQAVVYGQTPSIADVLGNDVDPTGRLLAVQSAQPVDGADVRVAVIRGRWLQITATRPVLSPNPQRIRYTITNGVSGTVVGDVSVQQLPAPKDGTPTAVDDYAVVRAGDNVVIAARDNDTDPSGDALTLVTQLGQDSQAGTLPVSSTAADPGRAYVSANLIRYQAPAVSAITTAAITYVVQDPSGNRATGTAYVTIVPEPTAERPNKAPTPPAIEGRVVAGDTITVQIPTSGADPDGDSVTLVGLETAPVHGRVLGVTPSSITYQAYPTSAETDDMSYVVTDRFGRLATGRVRIAVLPPGEPQPVVAMDDVITAAPGTALVIDPRANDIVAIGDIARLEPLEPLNPDLLGQARADLDTGMIQVTTPDPLKPMALRYGIRGASGDLGEAIIRVRGQRGVNIPPVIRSAYATADQTANQVTVDVLANAVDPDGASKPLTVSRVFNAPGATISGGKVTLSVLKAPQVVAYEVTDADGAAALAAIYVPAVGAGAPYVRPDAFIPVERDGSATVALSDLVVDPAGKPVILTTTDRLYGSPRAALSVEAAGKDHIKVTGLKGYVGPAAVSFQVTDGASATDPTGRRALISVPVQVGPETPVLRCPPTEVTVVQGGQSRPISIPELCHVWTARAETYADLQFVGRLPNQEPGLTVANDGPKRLVVTASGEANAGTRAELQVTVPGTATVPATLAVLVVPSAPPTMDPVTIQGVRAGTSATVNIAGYIRSQLGNPDRGIVSVSRISGAKATVETSGRTTLTVTPEPDAKGRIVLGVTITDIADTAKGDRHGSGTVTIEVLGHPDTPGAPRPVGAVGSREVLLTWATPADNGLPIEGYTVSWAGGTQECPATPCRITGLTNGVPYTFTVVAHNAVGDSPPSAASGPIVPDQVPPAPTALATKDPRDHSLTVTWQAPTVDGSPVTRYLVTWPGGRLETPATTVLATGLDNSAVTTFHVKAANEAGWGPEATVQGQSAGPPERPGAPTLEPSESADGSEQSVRVSWVRVAPNGPGATSYAVTMTGPRGRETICETTETSCVAPRIVNDGSTYEFSLVAANDYVSSPPSSSTSMAAVGRPGPFENLSAAATGESRQVRLRFTWPEAHDTSVTVTCDVGGSNCGTWLNGGGARQFDELVTVPQNGVEASLTLTARNSSSVPSVGEVTSDVVYGPLLDTNVTGLRAEGPYVAFAVEVDPQGLPAKVAVTVQVDGRRFDTLSDVTGAGPYAGQFAVKVGYGAQVTVTAKATRGSEQTSDADGTGTGIGTVSVTGAPASTCVPAQPCSDQRVTISVDNLPFSATVSCVINRPARNWGPFSFGTGPAGGATFEVPEVDFTANTGTSYEVVCDDGVAPAAPVSTVWDAP